MDWNWIETVARHQRTMRADAAPSNLDAATPAGSKTTSRSAQWNYIYAAASAKENWFIDAAAPLPCEDSHYKFRWQHQGNLVQSFQSNLETRMTKDNGTAHSAISLKHLKFNFKHRGCVRRHPIARPHPSSKQGSPHRVWGPLCTKKMKNKQNTWKNIACPITLKVTLAKLLGCSVFHAPAFFEKGNGAVTLLY